MNSTIEEFQIRQADIDSARHLLEQCGADNPTPTEIASLAAQMASLRLQHAAAMMHYQNLSLQLEVPDHALDNATDRIAARTVRLQKKSPSCDSQGLKRNSQGMESSVYHDPHPQPSPRSAFLKRRYNTVN